MQMNKSNKRKLTILFFSLLLFASIKLTYDQQYHLNLDYSYDKYHLLTSYILASIITIVYIMNSIYNNKDQVSQNVGSIILIVCIPLTTFLYDPIAKLTGAGILKR